MWLCEGVAGVSSTLLAAVVAPKVHQWGDVVVVLIVAAVVKRNVSGVGDTNRRWLWSQSLSCAVLACFDSCAYCAWS